MPRQIVINPNAKALSAGAKALRAQAKPLAFEANLAKNGIGDHYMKRSATEYDRLLKYAGSLEEMAGRAKPVLGIPHLEAAAKLVCDRCASGSRPTASPNDSPFGWIHSLEFGPRVCIAGALWSEMARLRAPAAGKES